jgi:hypothetical protein
MFKTGSGGKKTKTMLMKRRFEMDPFRQPILCLPLEPLVLIVARCQDSMQGVSTKHFGLELR